MKRSIKLAISIIRSDLIVNKTLAVIEYTSKSKVDKFFLIEKKRNDL